MQKQPGGRKEERAGGRGGREEVTIGSDFIAVYVTLGRLVDIPMYNTMEETTVI
jgi:hypothetical protein